MNTEIPLNKISYEALEELAIKRLHRIAALEQETSNWQDRMDTMKSKYENEKKELVIKNRELQEELSHQSYLQAQYRYEGYRQAVLDLATSE